MSDTQPWTTQALTYPDVGGTATAVMPGGYRHVDRRTRVGHGPTAFAAAVDAVLRFDLHRGLGLAVASSAPEAADGVTVVLRAGVGRACLRIPCRVVWAGRGERAGGFAYGTLPGHPALGEERFLVERDARDDVWLTVRAFSRPVWRLARLGGPVTRLLQRAFARRCGTVLARLVRQATAAP